MHAPRHRYYAFVARFVDAVVTDAVTQELTRGRRERLRQPAPLQWVTPATDDTRKAA
jgi:hypothetical protein